MISDKLRKKFKKFKKFHSMNNRKKWNKFKSNVNHIIMMHWTWPKKVFLAIFVIIFIGTICLYLPISYNYKYYEYVNNEYVFWFNTQTQDSLLINHDVPVTFNFVDALYLSVSSFTTTGLSGKIEIGTQMSFFGQFVVWVLLGVGGFGYASLFYLLGSLIKKVTNKPFFSSSISHIERGGTKITDSTKMIFRLFFMILLIQAIFTIIFTLIFYFTPFYVQQNVQNRPGLTVDSDIVYSSYNNFGQSLWKSLFLASAAINNSGFDLFGSSSLSLFRNDVGIVVQCLVLILFLFGGIGFPVIYDLSKRMEWTFKYIFLYRICNIKKFAYLEKEKFSSFSKICLISSLIIIIVSLVFTYLIEYLSQFKYDGVNQNIYDMQGNVITPLYKYPEVVIGESTKKEVKPFGNNHLSNLNFSIFFNTMSTRSAGFSTISMTNISEGTKWIFIILMFIGTSPSSTGGGLRTTTIAILCKSSFSYLGGMDKTSLFKRNIPQNNVLKAFIVTFFGAATLITFSIITYLLSSIKDADGSNLFLEMQKNENIYLTVTDFIFESSSSFGTCGLSAGIMTSQYVRWWSRIPIIILMFIGQLGMSQTFEIFARKVPKNNNPKYIEQSIRIG